VQKRLHIGSAERFALGGVQWERLAKPATNFCYYAVILMSMRNLAGVVLVVFFSFNLAAARAVEGDKGTARAEIFGRDKVHQFYIHLSAENYAAMEPKGGGFGGGRPGPPGPPGPPGARPMIDGADRGAGSFNFEFPYVHGDLETEGKAFKDVGVRYKGNGTYMMSMRQAKRSFKIDLDRYDAPDTFHAHKKLNLNSGVMDPTKAREILAYEVFRAADLPAPRTTLAEVTLTVRGKFDREPLGIYTLVEQVDKPFLKEHFGNGNGMLLKPEGIRGVPHLGDDVADYETTYNLKSDEPKPEDWKRLIEFTRIVNKADETEFRERIGEQLDVDAFTRFLAANTLLSSMDGFIGLGHNYYLYLSPKSGRFVFFPWDLDLAFGAFPMYGNSQQMADLSIDHPHVGDNKLIDRLLAMPEVQAAYRKELKKLIEVYFNVDKLGNDIDSLEAFLKEPVASEKAAAEKRKEQANGMLGMFGGETLPLKKFVAQRVTSVEKQLAGETKGYTPVQGFGFGGPPPGGGFGAGNQLARPLLGALDADKDKQVSESELADGMKRLSVEWDRDHNGSLDQKELADGLQKLLPTPMGPPGGPMPPR
jgi:spore coat protein H